MNVLFFTTHLNAGGITSYVLTLAKGLIRQGHSVHVVSSGGNAEGDFKSSGVKLLILNIRTKSELHPKLYLSLPALSRYIRANRIDILHAHTRVTQVMAQMLLVLTKTPYVSTCHGFFKNRLSRRLMPCWGNYVIAISPAVSDHLRMDLGIHLNRIALIESGVDLKDFAIVNEANRQNARQKFGLANEPTIGIIARLSDVKGQDILIRAMSQVVKKLPQAKLLIFGQGKMEYALKKMVEDLQLIQNVQFHAIVGQTAQALPLFDVFVMPSRQEGLGLSIMEAQAAGLPVIGSNVGGIPTLIQHHETGILVTSENSDELAQAIIAVLTNQELAKRLGVQARQFIEKNYSADFMVDKIENLYRKAIVEKKS